MPIRCRLAWVVPLRCVVCAFVVWAIPFGATAAPPTGGQIEKQFKPLPEPKSRPAAPLAAPPEKAPVVAPPGELRFSLRRVELSGMTVFPAGELASVFAPLIGRDVTLSELRAAANEITVRYRNAGYLLSQALIPAQAIEDGRVRVEIVEGYVDGFVLRGTTEAESPKLAELANRIVATRPARTETLEKYLLLMNDLGGAAVRGTLVPSPTTPGAATLFLDARRQPVAGGLALDNRGGRLLGPGRANADVEGHGLLSAHDRTALRAITSGDRKLQYVQLLHEQPIGSEGKRIGASLSAVRSRPSEQFAIALNQETESTSFALNYQHPFVRSRSMNLSARAALAAHDGETTLFGFPESEDRVRSARLGLSWDGADTLAGVNLIDVEYSQGIDGLGASSNGDPMLSRANGRVDYRKLTVYAARVQTISARWSVLVAVSAQRAMTDLLSSELFSFGGEQFGRGFDPSEMVGDHGAAGKLELRYGHPQPFGWLDAWSLYGFFDVGMVQQRTAAPGSEDKTHARSAGVGSRFDFGRQISAYVEWAKPMDRDVAAENNRDGRAYFGLSVRF